MVNLEQNPPADSNGHGTGTKPSSTSFSPENEEKNPFGLGDPNDRYLRKVEKDILVPKKMRDKARVDKCSAEVAAFTECCKKSSVAMVVTCRQENTAMKNCLTTWYQDPEFRKMCENEYLKERSEYRRTGIKQKHWKKQEKESEH